MDNIEQDIDYILEKTQQMLVVVENEQYHLLETKELIRQQLLQQFSSNYTSDEMLAVAEKLEKLVTLSTELTQQCEEIFSDTKQDILKLKKAEKVKNAYK